MNELKMTVQEMLEFHKLLERKLGRIKSNTQAEFVEKQMTVIWGMLSAALFKTAEELMPTVTNVLMAQDIDRKLLAEIVGIDRVNALPTRGTLELKFEEIEDVSESNELKSKLELLVQKSFAKNIPEAVRIYKEKTGSTKPNGICWLEIRKMFPDNYPFKMWDKHITTQLVNDGPISAFFSVKKHLKDWDDADIAIVMNNAIESRKADDTSVVDRVDTTLGLCTSRMYVKGYLEEKPLIEMLKGFEPVPDHLIGKRVKEILNICNPEERAKILSKKEYVEKGY